MRKISRRNFLAATSVLGLSAFLTACGGSSSKASSTSGSTASSAAGAADPSSHEKFKIGIVEVQLNDESTNRAEWFRNYVAPHYNCEFMFSEACSDLNATMTFIENAADAGCKGIINYYPVGANTQQLVELCAEYDMVFCENGGRNSANDNVYNADYENFGGAFMADQPATGKLFKDYLEETLDTSKPHGFIIGTGMAYQGNAQQTEISSNMMAALEDLYGMKFDQETSVYYADSAPVDAPNSAGLDVYCYPGGPNTSGWLEGLNAALQTGKYDYVLMAPNVIGNIMTMVNELESAMNKDFTVIGFGTFGEALTSAMNATDIFGNQALSMSTVKFTSIVSAMGFAKVYNLLTGHREAVLDKDGHPSVNLFRMNAVTSPEQLEAMSGWDKEGAWVADYDFIDSLLAEQTPGLTDEDIQNNIYAMDYDAIKARLG